ncbi:hypothetical protein ACFX1X_014627 [Malus domestica]
MKLESEVEYNVGSAPSGSGASQGDPASNLSTKTGEIAGFVFYAGPEDFSSTSNLRDRENEEKLGGHNGMGSTKIGKEAEERKKLKVESETDSENMEADPFEFCAEKNCILNKGQENGFSVFRRSSYTECKEAKCQDEKKQSSEKFGNFKTNSERSVESVDAGQFTKCQVNHNTLPNIDAAAPTCSCSSVGLSFQPNGCVSEAASVDEVTKKDDVSFTGTTDGLECALKTLRGRFVIVPVLEQIYFLN